MTVEHRTERYAGAGGLRLFVQSWHPASPRGALVNLHGLGDHGGLHPAVSSHFSAAGWTVYAPDLRGHGRSPGQRAYLRDWSEYRGDLRALVELVTARHEKPYVLGHSLGGLVTLEFALRHPSELRGAIAAAPPVGELGVPPILMRLGRIMSRVAPRLSLRVGMDLTGLARDPSVMEKVLADPLFHRRGTARLSTEVTAAIAQVQSLAPTLRVPTLLLHGTADRMVPPGGTRRFAERAPAELVTLREYQGGFHALFADWDGERVLRDVEAWMVARC
jgi:alpha-beta hydrolase superfamily lysophospholipase